MKSTQGCEELSKTSLANFKVLVQTLCNIGWTFSQIWSDNV